MSTTANNLKLTPLSGKKIELDGTIFIDAGVVTGATSITSTSFVGDLTGTVITAAQPKTAFSKAISIVNMRSLFELETRGIRFKKTKESVR